MIYTVKMQADRTQQWVDIYGPSKELSLLSPKVKVELNSAGSFTFVLPQLIRITPCRRFFLLI